MRLSAMAAGCSSSGSRSPLGPLFTVWGGVNTLAETLKYLSEEKSPEGCAILHSRLRVYTISDQDDTGSWIRLYYLKIHCIASFHAPNMYELAAWRGVSANYAGANNDLVGKAWLKENMQNVDPPGAVYPSTTWILEGDTPTFLWLLQNGLNDRDHIEWGGWGGRYGRVCTAGYAGLLSDSIDRVLGSGGRVHVSNHASIWRWRHAFQNDFAARMAWTVADSFSAVRQPPVVKVNGSAGTSAIRVTAKGGEVLTFDASETADPDHLGTTDHLVFQWYQYWDPSIPHPLPTSFPEVGGLVVTPLCPSVTDDQFLNENDAGFTNIVISDRVKVEVPDDRRWGDLHLILEVRTKGGKYTITRYKRVIFER